MLKCRNNAYISLHMHKTPIYELPVKNLTSPFASATHITHSHGSANVFKRRQYKGMEKAKIRPLAAPKSINRFSQTVACVIKSWTALGRQNYV